MTQLLVALAVVFLSLLVRAFLLPVSRAVVLGWNWALVRGLSPDVKARRLAEMRSELWEHTRAAREQGFTPAEIALQCLQRWLWGVWDDVRWAWDVRHAQGQFYVSLDESGDWGFEFHSGSTRYYVLAAVLTSDPAALHERFRRVRRQLRQTRDFRFRFGETSVRARDAFFRGLRRANFKVRLFVVDKTKISSPARASESRFLQRHLATMHMQGISGERGHGILLMDMEYLLGMGFHDPWGARDYWLNLLNPPGQPRKMETLSLGSASVHEELQLADMCAGAARTYFEQGNDSWFRFLKPKVDGISFLT